VKQNVPKCPKLCIFNMFPVTCTLTNSGKKMLTFCLLQAKLVVARHWKNTEIPNFKQ